MEIKGHRLTLIQEYDNEVGALMIDLETEEITQFNSNMLPIIVYDNIYITLKPNAPVDFILEESCLLTQFNENSYHERIYTIDLEDSYYLDQTFGKEYIQSVSIMKNGNIMPVRKEDYMDCLVIESPTQIIFASNNIILEFIDDNEFEIESVREM